MTKKEFATFAMALKTYFPKENLLPNQQAMELWFRELQDIPYVVAETALREYVHTNKWSPTIADIRAAANTVVNGTVPGWGDGWKQVLFAVSEYGIYDTRAAMDSFDDLTRETVKRIGFYAICNSENISTERANFRMIYEQLQQKKINENQMSLSVHESIKTIQHDCAKQID